MTVSLEDNSPHFNRLSIYLLILSRSISDHHQFNVSKCHSMRVTQLHPSRHIEFNYKLHQQTLEQVQSAKYLSLTITDESESESARYSIHLIKSITWSACGNGQKKKEFLGKKKMDWIGLDWESLYNCCYCKTVEFGISST